MPGDVQQMIAARAVRGRKTHAVLYREDGMVSVCDREPRRGWVPVDGPVNCGDCLSVLSRRILR